MHIRTSSQAHMAILRSPAHNLHTAFLLTRVVTLPYLDSSSSTVPVSSVRALVTSLLHLYYFTRHGPGFSLSLSVFWGLPVYRNKSRPVDTLNPECSLFIYRHDHRSQFFIPSNISKGTSIPPRSEVPLEGSYNTHTVPDPANRRNS